MANTNIRDLKVFEFNRALSYVSEILEIERKKAKLQREWYAIQGELKQWDTELKSSSSYTKDEISIIQSFMESINARKAEIDKEQDDLNEYEDELEKLVKKVLEFVIVEGEYFALTKEEIQESFAEEYIYILTEIKLDNNSTDIFISDLFEHKSDLILLLYDVYGREQEELISDIADADPEEEFENSFYDYFSLNKEIWKISLNLSKNVIQRRAFIALLCVIRKFNFIIYLVKKYKIRYSIIKYNMYL